MIALASKIAFLGLVVGWYAVRLPSLLRARRTPIVASRRGARERVLMLISGTGMGYLPIGYCLLGFGGFADRPAYPGLLVAGIAVSVVALALFYGSHRDLGREWSVSLDLRADHVLHTGGLYRYVRHPMYSAFWTWCIAQALLVPNIIAGFSGFVGFGLLYFFRVFSEEKMMQERFGDRYVEYASRTPRIIPSLRRLSHRRD